MQTGLRDNLEVEGYAVTVEGDGRAGLTALMTGSFDLTILDVMLPSLSGFDVLKQARAAGVTTPVIMLTAKGEEIDRVLGLELGADDYITKPFSLRELLARVRAVLRRGQPLAGEVSVVTIGLLVVDFASYTAQRRGAAAVSYTHLHPCAGCRGDHGFGRTQGQEYPQAGRRCDGGLQQ